MLIAICSWVFVLVTASLILKRDFYNNNFTSLFSILYLSFLVLTRPILLLLELDNPIPVFAYNAGSYFYEISLTNMAILVWLACYSLATSELNYLSKYFSVLFPPSNVNFSSLKVFNIALAFSFLLVILSFGTTLYFIIQSGGVAGFMFAVKVEKNYAGMYFVRQLAVIGSVIALMLFVYKKKFEHNTNYGLLKKFTLFLFVLGLAINYFWGNRINIALILFILFLVYSKYVNRVSWVKLVIFATSFLTLIQFLRLLRDQLMAEVTGSELIYETMEPIRHFSLSTHIAEYDGLMLALKDAGSKFDFRYGLDFIYGLTAWVPRFLWEGKPETFHVGAWFRRVYEPSAVNGWPITPIGDWYVNFHFFGVILGALITGVVVKAIDYRYKSNNAWSITIASTFGAFMIGAGIGPSFIQSTFFFLIPFWFIYFCVKNE